MPGARNSSGRGNRGTSVTPTSTEASTPAPNTEPATARRRRTKPSVSADAPETGSSVVAAVQRDLATIRRSSPELAASGLAMLALALAQEIDGENSATSKSMCAGQLRDTLDRLRELMPTEQEADELDELAARRDTKRVGGSAAPGL